MKAFRFNKTFIINSVLLLIAAMYGNQAKACGGDPVPWCDSNVHVKAIGGGKVYATGKSDQQTVANCTKSEATYTVLSNSHNDDIFPAATYLAAKPDDGWKFVKWECIDQQGTYSTSGATEKGTVLTEALPKVQKSGVSKRGGNNTGASGESTTPCTDVNATWYAYFEQVVTQLVKVESGNVSLGTAVIDKSENNTGDEVTITAWCGNTNNSPRSETIMFLGWYKRNETTGEEEFVTRENPYVFTITNSTQGTYVAHFDSGYSFWRVKNNRYNNYLTAKAKYTGEVNSNPLTIQNALSTQMGFDNDLAAALTDAGSMMQISVTGKQPNTSKEVWDIYVQNEHTNQYYGKEMIADGVFLQLTHQSNNTYVLNGNNNSFYLYENSSGDFTGGTNLLKSGYWQLEGIDKDLTTKENYFSVDPGEFVGPDNDGYYWTTLRVCFNMKYEVSEITPFIVSAVDENTGTMELTEVTGGVIPAKTCVLLRCNSTDIKRNVMIPTTAKASFNDSGNLLTSSTYYYKNQSVDNSLNLKGIRIDDGSLGFGGNTLTEIDGNRAYLSVDKNVKLDDITEVTLAGLVSEGEVGKKYAVTDLTCVAVREIDDEHTALYCKDDNAVAADARQVMADGQTDYMAANGFGAAADYDQSHWLELTIPGKVGSSYNPIGRRLTDVSGTLTDLKNPALTARALPTIGDENAYTLNNYIVPSLQGTQAGNNGRTYFFVTPQVMEVATINWAQWDATAGKFITPPSTTPGVNTAGLQGEFFANFSYAEGSELIENYPYSFKAVLRSEPGTEASVVKAPRRAGGTKSLVAYPLEPLTVERQDGQVVTTVDRVTAGRQVLRVDYCNLQGQVSHTPWPGLSIEVTRFDDGSVTTRKVLK